MKPNWTFFLLAASLVSMGAVAQPIIADGSLMPATGYNAPVSSATSSVLPGAAGAGVTWDFSAIAAPTIATVSVIDPATSPYISTFPAANFCLKILPTGGTAFYDYDHISAAKSETIASSYVPGSGSDYTPNPETEMPFPFAYTNSVTDTFQKTGGSPNSVIITYDGYGTLKTPFGTYTNIVRIKHDYGGTDVDYKWWTTSPLFIVAVYEGSSGTYTFIGGAPTGMQDVHSSRATVTIYPNPVISTGTVNVTLPVGAGYASLEISDITGRLVRTIAVTDRETTFSRDDMTAGLYLYKLLSDGGIVANGKFIVQ